MSRGQTLRALVNERLAAAAEEIFVLFERTIAEYEEELCHFKEENQRKQQLLDKVLSPEEQRIKQEEKEEEQVSGSVPEFSAVCVKTEESSLLQQRQTEHREETQGEDISSEPHFYSETEGLTDHSSDTDNDQDQEPFSCSAAQMDIDGDHYNQVQTKEGSTKLPPQNKSVPKTSVHSEHVSGARRGGAERKKHQCPFCNKRFERKYNLKVHMRVHTGERPYNCPFCMKTFAQKSNLHTHMRKHTEESTDSVSTSEKTLFLSHIS